MAAYCERCRLYIPDGMTTCRMCGGAVFEQRAEPSQRERPLAGSLPRREHSQQFSKWLLVIGLSLVVSPAIRLYAIFAKDLPLLTTDEGQAFLAQYPGLETVYQLQLASSVVLVLLALVVNLLFYTNSKRFPVLMMVYVGLGFLVSLTMTGVIHMEFPQANLAGNAYPLVRSMLYAALAIGYLYTAPEVKTRFVR